MRRKLLALIALSACGDNTPDVEPDRLFGGDTTVEDRTTAAFTHSLDNLDDAGRVRFEAGRGPFDFHWEAPQLGPYFNNDACLGCHAANGRGLAEIGQEFTDPITGLALSQALVRCSLAVGTPEVPGGDVPVPGYGLQLQDHAVVGVPEVFVEQTYIERDVYYGTGELVALREPRLSIRTPNGDPLPDMLTSLRQAPAAFGLGLLEAIPDDQILAHADPDDTDGDGISGKANLVWDGIANATRVGRFGAKANVSDLPNQIAGAFFNDIGLTNRLVHDDSGQLDVQNEQLDDTIFFVRAIAVPAQGPPTALTAKGDRLFDTMGCASCHVRTFVTGDASASGIHQLANQTIHPFTDLLLHDVGDDLTDSRPDFLASGREWRTPPLWGLGLVQVVAPAATFLHDGRARTIAEAILWHGGEAEPAREAFRTASADDRAALLDFLNTL